MKKLITIILALIIALFTAPNRSADQPHLTAVNPPQTVITIQEKQASEESETTAETAFVGEVKEIETVTEAAPEEEPAVQETITEESIEITEETVNTETEETIECNGLGRSKPCGIQTAYRWSTESLRE